MQPRKHLQRREHPNQPRLLTFSCNHRLPLFNNDDIKDLFARELTNSRERFGFNLYAWVVMPEHVHLLLWPRLPEAPVPIVLRELKRSVATKVIRRWCELDAEILSRISTPQGTARFWLPGGGHDNNVESTNELANMIDYIHHNPVRRDLAATATGWAWSSARWYAGDRAQSVPIDPLPATKPGSTN